MCLANILTGGFLLISGSCEPESINWSTAENIIDASTFSKVNIVIPLNWSFSFVSFFIIEMFQWNQKVFYAFNVCTFGGWIPFPSNTDSFKLYEERQNLTSTPTRTLTKQTFSHNFFVSTYVNILTRAFGYTVAMCNNMSVLLHRVTCTGMHCIRLML